MKISWDFQSHQFTGITQEFLEKCKVAYPDVNLAREIPAIELWVTQNGPFKRYGRLLTNCLAKAQRHVEEGKQRTAEKPPETLAHRPLAPAQGEPFREVEIEKIKADVDQITGRRGRPT